MRYWICLLVGLSVCMIGTPDAQAALFEVHNEGNAKPYTTLAPGSGPEDFTFAIVPDRTGGNRPGPFREAMKRLNGLGPDFVMSVGDLIEGYSSDAGEVRTMWEELDGIVQGLRMPFFYVPGNHDISNAFMSDVWEKRYGRAYYHFVHKNALFLVMNTQDPPGQGPGFSEEQVRYFKEAIRENADVRWTFLFFHQPTWVQGEDPLAEIEEALGDRPYTVFAGHIHSYSYAERDGRKYIVCATAGGGSSIAGPLWGAFDHVVWVRVDEEGPDITNLLLKGLYGPDVVTEEMEHVRKAVNESEPPLTTSPVIVPPDGLPETTITVEAENRYGVPALLTGSFAANDDVAVSPADLEIPLAVKGRRRAELLLTRKAGLNGRAPAPLVFEGLATYYLPDGRELPIDVRKEINFYPAWEGRRWDFDAGLEGWGEANQASLSHANGVLEVHATGEDPYMIVDLRPGGPAGPLGLRLRMRTPNEGPVQIFWTTENARVAAQERSSGTLVEGDGAWHDYVVEFESDAPLTTLRLDSGDAPGLIEYDYIELVQR